MASRDRIIDAVIALVDEDQGIPGAEAIAARAKVGLRSVFRHFGDMDGLYTAVLDKVGRRYSTIVRPYLSDTWQGQVNEAMERRVGMFEGVWPYRRVGDMYRQRSMLMQDGWNAFNLGTGRGYSVLEMVRAFEKESGRAVPYKVTGRREGDVACSYADVQAATDGLNWKATRSLEDMCSSAWHFQSRLAGS